MVTWELLGVSRDVPSNVGGPHVDTDGPDQEFVHPSQFLCCCNEWGWGEILCRALDLGTQVCKADALPLS